MASQFGLHPQEPHDRVAWLESVLRADADEGVIAHELVASVYNWFSIESEAVPFTDNNDGRVAISPARLLEAGG